MAVAIIDPNEFTTNGILIEDVFLEKASHHDWSQYTGKKVLVRGCTSTIIPPWVYMYITARLSPLAKSIRFGNEHSNIVIYRGPGAEE